MNKVKFIRNKILCNACKEQYKEIANNTLAHHCRLGGSNFIELVV